MPDTMRPLPVIINPASGPDQPVLKLLNRGFAGVGRAWDLLLTRRAGDAERLAGEFRAAGEPLVAVCGGDGTVKEAARALAGGETALAILPGGTGNALAHDLRIPLNLEAAAALAGRAPAVRPVDLGRIGEHVFILRASLGLETELLRGTDRGLKDQLGGLAYPVTALQKIGTLPFVDYQITVDGQPHTARGVQCAIANSAQMGVTGLALAQGVSVSDGRLDVIVLSAVDMAALVSLLTSNVLGQDTGGLEIQHWQGREISVAAEPAQEVAFGETVIGRTPITATVWPGALKVVVPG